MNDNLRELKIALAKCLMVAGYFVARQSSAWLTRLANGRSLRQIERMESRRGLR